MSSHDRRRGVSPWLAALAAMLLVIGLGAPRLGADPLTPLELAWVGLAAPGWLTAGPPLGTGLPSPETLARGPGLLLAALAAGLIAAAGARRGTGGAAIVLAGMSPALITAARTACPAAPVAVLVALGALLLDSRARAARVPGMALLGLGALGAFTISRVPSFPGPDRLVHTALSAWGSVFGGAVGPWRLDVALPVLLMVMPALWLGSGHRLLTRLLVVAAILAAVAGAGFTARSIGAASLAGASLSPLLLALELRGIAGARSWLRRGLVLVAIGAGLIGVLGLNLGRDLVDPDRTVPWDEAARMLAVLDAPNNASVEGRPTLPVPLTFYRGPVAPIAAAKPPGPARVLVVTHSPRGGLGRPGIAEEDRLAALGYALKGEILLGPIEPGLERLLQRLGGYTPASHVLRIRRWERR